MLISGIPGLMGGLNSIIKSIQQVTIVIAAGSTTGTASISNVVQANSYFHYAGESDPKSSATFVPNNSLAGAQVTAANQVTATRNTSDASNAHTVYGTVVEYQAGVVNNIQQGTTTMSAATSNTSAITSVDVTKSVCHYNGCTITTSSDTLNNYTCNAVLTSPTVVTVGRPGAGGNATVYWVVIEYKAGILASAPQAGSVSIASTTTANATITSVTAANTLLFYGGQTCSSSSSAISNTKTWLQLTSGTNIAGTRVNSTAAISVTYFTAVEYLVQYVKSMNRGSIVIATSQTQNTASKTAVNLAKTFINYVGNTTSTANEVAGVQMAGLTVTDATTDTATRGNASASATTTVGYETMEHT